MKKGEILQGRVRYVDFPNKGMVKAERIPQEKEARETRENVEDEKTTDEKFVIVKNALPGQVVSFRINKIKKGQAEGALLEVIEHSNKERKSPCPHFGECGGCTYQTMPYEEQLSLKESQIAKLLAPFTDKFEGIRKSPVEFAYRNKMEFTFGDEYKGGPLSLGMHKRGSFYDIVTVTDCQIVDEDYRKILHFTKEYFGKRNIPYFHRMQHTGYLRHLCVRKAVKTGEILIALITTTQMELDLTEYAEGCLRLSLEGKIAGIVHTLNDSVADTVKKEGTQLLYGKDYFDEELLGLKFHISQFSFFQTNTLGAEVLYSTVREFLGDFEITKPVVFDLYTGTGTIAQLLAPVSGKVVGVEIVPEAVEAAKENAKENYLDNCEFIAGDVLKVLDEIEEKPDYIVLDPPRDGIHPRALSKIIAYGVKSIVYVSCKPTSLVRDLEVFTGNGYEVTRACCVDMFPATVHVETVCLLTRINTGK